MDFTAKRGSAFALALAGGLMTAHSAFAAVGVANPNDPVTLALQEDVQTIVFIYAENRSFDELFGHLPGANGLVNADGSAKTFNPQLDRDNATVLAQLPPSWGGVTAAGNTDPTGTTFRTVTQSQSAGLPNAPFSVESAFTANSGVTLNTFDTTRDLYHRFFENQMQINGGTNDQFAAWADSGGLVMGHWDYSNSQLYALGKQYVVADDFFQAAYGGSFLNHQYLICACAPSIPAATVTANKMSINVLTTPNAKGVAQLATKTGSPASALTGVPVFQTGNIAPLDYFGAGDGYRGVNTMQPPFQPSGNAPADVNGTDALYANPAASTTVPPQTQATIGDQLDAAGVNWAWYATSWNAATADGQQASTAPRSVIYFQGSVANVPNPNDSTGQAATLASASKPRGAPDFQTHHQPFNYYAKLDPVSAPAYRAQHLKDYNDLLNDIQNGSLPPVVFYKPQGNYNQHHGYANLDDGDAHIAELVSKLQMSPQWQHMVIVITFDENGGVWDHVAPPKGDLLGPGTRIPALIISPFAKTSFVDHTQYDTASIQRLINRRYHLAPLAGISARDAALVNNGAPAMGDLTNALDLPLTVPAAPTNLTATAKSNSVSLSWSGSAGAAGYRVYQGSTAGGEGSTAIESPSGSPATVGGLAAGGTYYFTVKAYNSAGLSVASKELKVTTVSAPSAPTGLIATAKGNVVTLTWTGSAGATVYKVYQGTAAGGEGSTAIESAAGTTAVVSGLVAGSTYFFTVKAGNNAGLSGPSNEAQVSTVAPLAAPTSLAATAKGDLVHLSWTASAGASGYRIYLGTTAGGEAAKAVESTSGTAAVVSGLTTGTTYYFTVKAYSNAGTLSPASNEVQIVAP